MSYQLQRGQNVSLSRLTTNLQRVAVGLGWDAQTRGGPDFNLDSSAFMVGANGKVSSESCFIFYNNKTSPDGALQHQGDNLTGSDAQTLGHRNNGDFRHWRRRIIVVAITIYHASLRSKRGLRKTNSRSGSAVTRLSNTGVCFNRAKTRWCKTRKSTSWSITCPWCIAIYCP